MNKNILLEEKKDIDKSNIIGDATSDIELENDPLYGIKLDPSNKDFWNAANLILETENKNNVIYLTGKAGTGKTTLLKYLTRECKKMGKKYVTLAPTGVAAVNANGQTIHSFFHIDQNTLYVPKKPIPDKPFDNIFNYCKINENGWNLLKELDLIIIDEISMVPCNVIDLIDLILRSYRGNKKPFGGVQLLLIGDVFQLTPVMTNDDGSAGIIKMFYKDKFFFNAKVMEQFIANKNFISIELQKIYRQTDEKFINLLNNVRFGNVDTDVLDKINSKYNPNFDTYSNNDYIIITTKNVTANDYNNSKLEKLEGNKKKYEAIIDGEFPINMYPTKEKVSYIELKKGSQVMFIKNGKGFYNGLIGIIENLDEDEISVSIKISTNARRIVKVERYKWENVRFQLNNENKIESVVLGTFTQFPLKLAWAITVHKSQGLTFKNVIEDVQGSWASGQVYVALSRCTSLNGMILKSKINKEDVKIDRTVLEFSKEVTPDMLVAKELQKSRAEFYYKKAKKEFKSQNIDIKELYKNYIKAINFSSKIRLELYRLILRYIRLSIMHNTTTINNLNEKISLLNNTINNNNQDLINKNNKILSLNNDINNHKILIEQQKNEIYNLNNTIDTKEQIIALKEETISNNNITIQDNNNQIFVLNARINELQNELLNEKGQLDSYSKTIIQLNAELERIRNITWYQKLFGKK